MKRIYQSPLMFFLFLLISNILTAQPVDFQLIGSTGGYFQNSDIKLSWSVGETVIETFSASNLYLTSGFQQPYYYMVSVKEKLNGNSSVSVFPNPMTTKINCKIDDGKKYSLKILDITGKEIINQSLDSQYNTIDLTHQTKGNYLFTIFDEFGTEICTYKIVKLK